MVPNKAKAGLKDTTKDESSTAIATTAATTTPTQLDICLKVMKSAYEANISSIYKRMVEMTRMQVTDMA